MQNNNKNKTLNINKTSFDRPSDINSMFSLGTLVENKNDHFLFQLAIIKVIWHRSGIKRN